jgi:hypothetical protein
LKATVSTFPSSDVYDLSDLLTSMGIGEAAVTILSERGTPTPVAWTLLRPPTSRMGPLQPAEQQALLQFSPLLGEYGTTVDRDSAYERLLAKVSPAVAESAPRPDQGRGASVDEPEGGVVGEVLGSSVFKSFARSAASAAGREISRSLFGTASGRRRRR